MNYLFTHPAAFIPFLTSLVHCSHRSRIRRELFIEESRRRPAKAAPPQHDPGSLGARETTAATAPSLTAPQRADRAAPRSARASWRVPVLSHRDEEGEAEFPSASGTSRPRGGIIDSLFGHPWVRIHRCRHCRPLPPAETQRTAVCARRKQPTSTTSSTGWRKRRTATSLTNGSSEAPPCCWRFILTLSLTELTRPSRCTHNTG